MADDGKMLDGVTVLEVGVYLTAPKPARVLAELGADVIKIEQRGGSPWRRAQDVSRTAMPQVDRGKRNVALDLGSDRGRSVFLELAADADVIVQNLSPGALESLELGYEDVRAVNVDIIYCAISGYGQTGPLSGKRAVDLMAQGMSGIAYQNAIVADADEPVLSGWFLVDEVTALTATVAILGALYDGSGTHIDVAMLDSIVGAFEAKASRYAIGEQINPAAATRNYAGPLGQYEVADGYITIWPLPHTEEMWLNFWEILEFEDWVDAPRFVHLQEIQDHEDEVEPRIEERLRERSMDYWLGAFDEAGIPSAPVLPPEEAFGHEQLEDRQVTSVEETDRFGEYFLLNFPAMFSEYEVGTGPELPKLGEHTTEVLKEAGFSGDDIEELYAEDVIR